jgi:hypothetical protein
MTDVNLEATHDRITHLLSKMINVGMQVIECFEHAGQKRDVWNHDLIMLLEKRSLLFNEVSNLNDMAVAPDESSVGLIGSGNPYSREIEAIIQKILVQNEQINQLIRGEAISREESISHIDKVIQSLKTYAVTDKVPLAGYAFDVNL